MRILMTADTVGGIWTYALGLARELGQHDVEIHLATMGAVPSIPQRTEAAMIPNLFLHKSNFKLEWMENPWEDVKRAGDWLLNLESRVRPDLVHLNEYCHGSLAWSHPVLIVGHSCVRSWWNAVRNVECGPEWGTYTRAVRMGLRAADLVVAPSKTMLSALQHHYGPFSARVIYNSANPSLFVPKTKQPFIFAAGRVWDPAKNIKALDDVASQLDWPVFVAGEDQHPGSRTEAAQLSGVNALGRLSTQVLSDWFGRASIFAAPARYEPFGLSILEAGFAGCALVLGDIPSLREIWNNAALFVAPEDPEAFASALNSLIRNPDDRAALSCWARTRAVRFTPQKMASEYLNAYFEILSPGACCPRQHQYVSVN